jgi:YbbR domain-containing protein
VNKRIIIVSLAVFCAVLTVVAIIYHASIQNASPNPTSTPSPSPTPPTAEWGYMPVEYFNTLSSTGFDNIDPLSNKAEGQVTFTISKGKTGIAVLDVQSLYTLFPHVSPSGNFNVSNNCNYEPLPNGITITFDPANVTINPEQGAQVKMNITIDPNTTLTGKVEIGYWMISIEPENPDVPVRQSFHFVINIKNSE